MKVLRLLFAVIGVILFIDGLFYSFLIRFNIGTAMTMGIGCLLLIWSIVEPKLTPVVSKKGLKRTLYRLGVVGLGFYFSLSIFLAVYGVNETVDYKEDAMIVLGAGLRGDKVSLVLAQRLDQAVLYHKKNPKAFIVVSGGQGPDEWVSEAKAMSDYLVTKGVPESVILKEAQSTSTYENFKFSQAILETKFSKPYKVAFVSNAFHMFRAEWIASTVGLKTNRLPAETQLYMMPVVYFREVLAVVKQIFFGN